MSPDHQSQAIGSQQGTRPYCTVSSLTRNVSSKNTALPVSLALKRQSKKDQEFEASLVYIKYHHISSPNQTKSNTQTLKAVKGAGEGSAVQHSYCSYREPKLSPQHFTSDGPQTPGTQKPSETPALRGIRSHQVKCTHMCSAHTCMCTLN